MRSLNEILHELGISKVKLAKFLGVSRQMIYNYLELEDLNKWPKDKKVLLFNLLGIKSAEELDSIKIDTDYILDVESRLDTLFVNSSKSNNINSINNIYNGLNEEKRELLSNIIAILKERLEDNDDYSTIKYLHNYLQSLDNCKELKYVLAYYSKSNGYTKPLEFVYDNSDDQFIFESILFCAMALYTGGGVSKTRIIEAHKRFVDSINNRMEEKMSRTLELNNVKMQALKELGYTEINESNASEVLYKITEIQARNGKK